MGSLAQIEGFVAEAARCWGEPALADGLRLDFSSRMRTSLGRAYPARGEVRLNAALREAPTELLREVVLHELAHLVVYRRHGRAARPHGPEWKALLRTVGLEPRVRLPESVLPELPGSRRRARWRHRCPVCRAERRAGRPVRNWRCARCVAAGLGGELLIVREGA